MASKSFYNAHSNTYERMASNATLNIIKQMIPSLLPNSVTPSSYVLDNACGTGIVAKLIKDDCPAAHIKGTDIAPAMVDMFKARAQENGWENIETDVLDVRDLRTLDDETFTHVITNFGFSPTPDDPNGPLEAAKEIYRVLKKDGCCVVTTWCAWVAIVKK